MIRNHGPYFSGFSSIDVRSSVDRRPLVTHAEMLRLEMLKVKADLERELSKLV